MISTTEAQLRAIAALEAERGPSLDSYLCDFKTGEMMVIWPGCAVIIDADGNVKA